MKIETKFDIGDEVIDSPGDRRTLARRRRPVPPRQGQGPRRWHRHPNGGGLVEDTATVAETAYIGPDAVVSGNARVFGNAVVSGEGLVAASRDVLTIGPVGSEDQFVTVHRTRTGHRIAVGCWDGPDQTIDDLADEVLRRAPDHVAEYRLAEALCRLRIAEWEAGK